MEYNSYLNEERNVLHSKTKGMVVCGSQMFNSGDYPNTARPNDLKPAVLTHLIMASY